MTQLQGFPDFFVVGAPRCGTTALCGYLARNPQVCFSRPKETHYFAQLVEAPPESDLQREYIDRFFGHCTAEYRKVGEGSVSYLHLPGAIERILRFNPAAQFIAMVRNPLTMLPSYHQRLKFLLQEEEADFATAWALEPTRARGERIPPRCLDPRLLLYSKVARLGTQVERLFERVGRDRAHIIVFDDFEANPLQAYRQVLEFLDVDYDGQTEFERRFESQMFRHYWLQRLLFVPVAHGEKMVDTLQRRKRKYRRDGSKRKDLIKWLTDWNKTQTPPPPLSEGVADTVREHLRPDVQLLSRLLQRDLNFWLDQ